MSRNKTQISMIFVLLMLASCSEEQPADKKTTPSLLEPATKTAEKDIQELYPLTVDSKLWIKGAKLSNPKDYWNEIEQRTCLQLNIHSQNLGYVFAFRKMKSVTIVHTCSEYADKSQNKESSIYGDVSLIPSELYKRNNGWAIKPYKLPDFTIWPNGAFCNNLTAYWGVREGGDLYAYIYDFSDRSVIQKKKVGKITIATDHFGFLPKPNWQPSCGSVKFGKHEFVESEITLNI